MVLSFSFFIDEPMYLPGVPVKQIALSDDVLECPATSYGNLCADDCATMMICSGSIKPLVQTKCPSINPYCVKNKCSSTPDDNNPSCKLSSFRCTSEGYFPDPNNCTRFQYCPEQTDPAKPVDGEAFQCPPNYVYNSKGFNCMKRVGNYNCNTLSCSRSPNRFTLYTAHKAYYAYCVSIDNANETVLFKCEDVDNFEYNVNTYECEFKCKAEGRYPALEVNQYYECYRNGYALIPLLETCPKNTVYNIEKKICIKVVTPPVDPPTDPDNNLKRAFDHTVSEDVTLKIPEQN